MRLSWTAYELFSKWNDGDNQQNDNHLGEESKDENKRMKKKMINAKNDKF